MLEEYDLTALGEIEKYLPDFDQMEFALMDIDIPAHLFLNWKKSDLLLKNIEETEGRKWVRITYTEAIWLKFLQKIREYELPYDAIREVRNLVVKDFYEIMYSAIQENIFSEIEENETLAETRRNQMNDVIRALTNSNVSKKQPFNSIFNFLIIDELVLKSNNCIRIFKTDTRWNVFYTNDAMLNTAIGEEIKKDLLNTHFCFALKDCIEDLNFSFVNAVDKRLESIDSISSKEKELIKLIRTKEFKEIKIKMQKSKEDFTIESTQDGTISNSDLKKIATCLGFKDYKKISITKRNEKNSYFELIK